MNEARRLAALLLLALGACQDPLGPKVVVYDGPIIVETEDFLPRLEPEER